MADDKPGMALGRGVEYCDRYSPQLLYPLSRQSGRDTLGVAAGQLPFTGVDIWTAYELSWLNARGKPQVACAEFRFPCESEFIIESKSFKLYLNSLNQTRFDSTAQLHKVLTDDLSAGVAAAVDVKLIDLDDAKLALRGPLPGHCLDSLDIEVQSYRPDPALLSANTDSPVNETLYSHLLRSLCPVTGQPDWGSVITEYSGAQIDREALLRYLIGYRLHQEFHEQCVERIFIDLLARCKPATLSVYARYVRRGGLDINPYRSTVSAIPENLRLQRQ